MLYPGDKAVQEAVEAACDDMGVLIGKSGITLVAQRAMPHKNGGIGEYTLTKIPVTSVVADAHTYNQMTTHFRFEMPKPALPYLPDSNLVHSFRMTYLPGCCGVVVAHDAMTNSNYAKRGVGTRANRFRQELARLMGYTVLLCTYTDGGTERIVAKEEYIKALVFNNKRTSKTITLAVKEV